MGASPAEDILRPLSYDEIELLTQIYENHFPKAVFHRFALLNVLKFKKLYKEEDVPEILRKTIYTHRNGDLKKNGTYISVSANKLFLSYFTLEDDMTELKECLEQTRIIDLNIGPLFCSIHDDQTNVIKSIATLKNCQIEHETPSINFFLEKEEALNLDFEVPEGFSLERLKPENSDFINSMWPHRGMGSEKFIRGVIELNKGLGMYKKGELVAWVLQNEFLGLGVLQTIESERGQGLATVLTKALSKLIAEEDDLDVITFSIQPNVRAHKLLQKAGFEKKDFVTWIKLSEQV